MKGIKIHKDLVDETIHRRRKHMFIEDTAVDNFDIFRPYL